MLTLRANPANQEMSPAILVGEAEMSTPNSLVKPLGCLRRDQELASSRAIRFLSPRRVRPP